MVDIPDLDRNLYVAKRFMDEDESTDSVAVVAALKKWEDDPYVDRLFDAKNEKWEWIDSFVDVIDQANTLAKTRKDLTWRDIYFKFTGDRTILDNIKNWNDGDKYDVLNHLLVQWPKETIEYILLCMKKLSMDPEKEESLSESLTRSEKLEKYLGFLQLLKVYKLLPSQNNVVSTTQANLSETLDNPLNKAA